jgi:succinate dehydrogenase / fumarate reductase flavoprotein subunit
VNPANKRKYDIIVVGSGLGGRLGRGQPERAGLQRAVLLLPGFAAPRALDRGQGGINAAKNYQNDGDSIYRLFYDTVKGGDFRAREANVYRLAQISVSIIDQCVAQGVPFAREYAASSPTVVRRRAGVAHLLRARARPASSCSSARTRRSRRRCSAAA